MKKQVGFRLSQNSIERLDVLSVELEMSRTDVVEFLLTAYENGDSKVSSVSDEVVFSLLRQLEEKDRQLLEKDSQMNQLLEQSRNYQVLLKQERDTQVLLLKSKKVGWFRRLLGYSDIDVGKVENVE